MNSEQVKFEDLVNSLDMEVEGQTEKKEFKTISGKPSEFSPEWEKYTINELDAGDCFEGKVEVSHFVNDDRKYDSLRVRVIDDDEVLDAYVNMPKPDKDGRIKMVSKNFDFYRTCFDFVYSVLRMNGEENVVDATGEEVNVFRNVPIINFAKFVDQHERVGVKITEGDPDSLYNSFIIYKLE